MAIHKSAMGKPVDMASIRTQNEKVRAIGNMRVNARGDLIDNNNQVIQQASQRVNMVYTKATSAPKTPVADVHHSEPEHQPVTQRVAHVQPQISTKLEPVVDLFEELSHSELELDMDDEFELPPVEPKQKKK